MISLGFIALTIIDLAAAVIVFAGALNDRMRLYPTWHKVGLILASFGLLAQGMRNIAYLLTGVSPSDADLPFWALKDIGIALIAFVYLAMAVKARMNSKKQAPKRRKAPARGKK